MKFTMEADLDEGFGAFDNKFLNMSDDAVDGKLTKEGSLRRYQFEERNKSMRHLVSQEITEMKMDANGSAVIFESAPKATTQDT